MTRCCVVALRLSLVILLLSMLAVPATTLAQPTEHSRAQDPAPANDFQSQGIGLTAQQLTVLYGPYDVGQGSIFTSSGAI